MNATNIQIDDLVIDPQETLAIEIKNWLPLAENAHKATLAKAVIALANHGGGFIVIGFQEENGLFVEDQDRPDDMNCYSTDAINGIVRRFCDPAIQCAVRFGQNSEGARFPVIQVPGGHKVPIRAKRGSENNTLRVNDIFIRKPGPMSETPNTSADWDELFDRCMRNRRDELADQIRALINPSSELDGVPLDEEAVFSEWVSNSERKWQQNVDDLQDGAGPRMENGRFEFAYKLFGEIRNLTAAEFLDVLRQSVVRHTGWPPFWVPTRPEIEPHWIDDAAECWIGGDRFTPIAQREPDHSDFWRVSSNGSAYLTRGYTEDSGHVLDGRVGPGEVFDLTLPIWRLGETILHARSLANNLIVGEARVAFSIRFTGLNGRELVSINRDRPVTPGRVSRQDEYCYASDRISVAEIDDFLPELVHRQLSGLYSLFGFFELSNALVTNELNTLRQHHL